MRFALVLAATTAPAFAADEAKPLAEEDRVKLVAKWQEIYKSDLAKKVEAWEKAKTQYAIDPKIYAGTLTRARDAVARLKANPLTAGDPITSKS